jgi:hypothetical protein
MSPTPPPTPTTNDIKIPTFPNFSLPPAAVASLLARIHDVETEHRPLTIHKPFTAQLLHAMSTNIHLDILTTANRSAFTTALPRLSDTHVEQAVAELEDGVFEALQTYFSTAVVYDDRLLGSVWIFDLLREIHNVIVSVFRDWKKDLEGVLIGDEKPLEDAVRKELRRVSNLLVGLLVWWHGEYEEEVRKDAAWWRYSKLGEWVEEQGAVAAQREYLDLKDKEGVSGTALGFWEEFREHCLEEYLIREYGIL